MNLSVLPLLTLLLLTLPGLLFAQQEEREATNQSASDPPEDTSGKFLPLPIIITEPAIGEGLGAGLVYFHADPGADRKRLTTASELNRADRKQTPPPTATGVFGFYTNNDTKGFGVGHSRTFKEDTWRLTALLADAKIIATYYISDFPFDFSLEGTIAFARVKRRFGHSNLFVGFATSYLDSEITFPLDPALPGDEPLIPGIGFRDVGASLSFLWDSRDDTMMPSSGWLARRRDTT